MNRKKKIFPRVKLAGYSAFLAALIITAQTAGAKKASAVFPQAKSIGASQTVQAIPEVQLVSVTGTPVEKIYYDIPLTAGEQDAVREAAEEYGVPFALALAVIETESGYNPEAKNGKAWGAMQIHEVNHRALKEKVGVEDWFNLYDNARAGCYLLGGYLEKYEDETAALMAYNLGEGGAKRKWKQGIFQTAYTDKVKTARENLRAVLKVEVSE